MQTAINPALAAAMTLERAAQVGEFSPVTPDGSPTVAAQLMQRAAPPSVPQVAQQAGLGGQIQAMQQQQAQQALMQQAMQQRQAPAGLTGLNPQMGNFAEGGIVGYAEAGVAEDEIESFISPEFGGASGMETNEPRLRVPSPRGDRMMTPAEMRAENYPEEYIQRRLQSEGFISRPSASQPAEVSTPATPAQTSPSQVAAPSTVRAAPAVTPRPIAATSAQPPTGVEALFEKERAEYAKIKGPATAQEILAREQMDRPTYEQFLRSRGVDPDMLTKRGEEDKALIEQQRALLRERMEREKGKDTFLSRVGAAARGFRQMQGQGIGDAVASAHDNLARQLQTGEIRMDQFRDAEIRLNELEITRRRALDDARRATAEGDWNRASQALTTERNATNEIIKLTAPTFGKQATAVVQERQAQEAGAARRADQNRIQELYQLRLNTLTGGKPPTDEQKMEAMEYALQTVRGAGSAARTAMAGQRLTLDQLRALQKTYADQAADTMLPKEQRAQAAQMLNQVNEQIAASAGIAAPQSGKGSGGPYYAVNPKTGERIMSNDGVNWQPAR